VVLQRDVASIGSTQFFRTGALNDGWTTVLFIIGQEELIMEREGPDNGNRQGYNVVNKQELAIALFRYLIT